MLDIDKKILDQIVTHAQTCYPDEACGFLFGEKGQDSVSEFHPCRNIYNEMHTRDPERFPRTARTAYLIDSKEQEKILREAQAAGQELKAIFHSHPDHDAYFSEEDRQVACPWGEPLYPGVSYLVVSVYKGRLKEINEFWWDDKKKDFDTRSIISA